MRKRYRAAGGRRERGELLDELVEVAGYTRKHAISLMNRRDSELRARRATRPGRPRAYRHCLAAIEVLWETLDYCCAQRLHPQLLPLAETLARHGEIELPLEVKSELGRISRSTLARRLRELPRRKPRPLLSGHHPSRLLKSQVPVDRYRWNEDRPGALEVDLVDHGGGRVGGHHAFTLSVVDVVSGWSRRRAVMGRSQAAVQEALRALLSAWPTRVWALHSDNGGEFLSAHLIHYCQAANIAYHRSRPYRKNDNAHVEQKNRQLVREIVGFERVDTPTGLRWLNRIYGVLDPYANLFLPSLKVVEKIRHGSKLKKRYDTARTPLERLQETNALLPHAAERLAQQHQRTNPRQLRRTLDRLQGEEPNQPHLARAAD